MDDMQGHKVTFLSPGPQITGCNTAFKFIYMYYTGQCKKAGPSNLVRGSPEGLQCELGCGLCSQVMDRLIE